MDGKIDSIEMQQNCEKIPYNYERVQQRISEIRQKEHEEERRKRPGQELKPDDPMILVKF